MNEHMMGVYIENIERALGRKLTESERVTFIYGFLYGSAVSEAR
jgi:hypothetical protein